MKKQQLDRRNLQDFKEVVVNNPKCMKFLCKLWSHCGRCEHLIASSEYIKVIFSFTISISFLIFDKMYEKIK